MTSVAAGYVIHLASCSWFLGVASRGPVDLMCYEWLSESQSSHTANFLRLFQRMRAQRTARAVTSPPWSISLPTHVRPFCRVSADSTLSIFQ